MPKPVQLTSFLVLPRMVGVAEVESADFVCSEMGCITFVALPSSLASYLLFFEGI